VDGVTRDEMYDRLHARLESPPRRLTALERDVMAQAAARSAAARAGELTFQLRPGLIAEMLRFYDQLRRQSQQVKRCEELIEDALGWEDLDRAARRMRIQTRFLAGAFREYERLVAASSGCDEHTLRDRLIAEPARDPVAHIVVTVADWIAESEGLFVADFDLLTRIPGLATLEIIATENVLASGFDERLHEWWPGIEDTRFDGRRSDSAIPDAAPVRSTLVVPGLPRTMHPESPLPNPESRPANTDLWWTYRDREEELMAVARQIKADEAAREAVPLIRTAVVFKRPLPYLYAAAEVFRSAGIPFHAFDALPLAAEPTAAALDLVLDAVASNFTRATLVALLRSPHFVFADDEGLELTRESISALDRMLSDVRYLGDPERLETIHEVHAASSRFLVPAALDAARAAARQLAPLLTPRPASEQLSLLLTFWNAQLRPIAGDDPSSARERRARAAIAALLASLAEIHAAHDDPEWTVADLGVAVRRWIEEHTFDPEPSGDGVQLLDDQAARYGDFDDLAIVGLVESDWPEKTRRNIFYPPSVLKSCGWPSERARRAGADARFLDLLASASRRTTVSTFTLDDDALVTRSMQLDEIPRARFSMISRPAGGARVFEEEALSLDPPQLDALDSRSAEWA